MQLRDRSSGNRVTLEIASPLGRGAEAQVYPVVGIAGQGGENLRARQGDDGARPQTGRHAGASAGRAAERRRSCAAGVAPPSSDPSGRCQRRRGFPDAPRPCGRAGDRLLQPAAAAGDLLAFRLSVSAPHGAESGGGGPDGPCARLCDRGSEALQCAGLADGAGHARRHGLLSGALPAERPDLSMPGQNARLHASGAPERSQLRRASDARARPVCVGCPDLSAADGGHTPLCRRLQGRVRSAVLRGVPRGQTLSLRCEARSVSPRQTHPAPAIRTTSTAAICNTVPGASGATPSCAAWTHSHLHRPCRNRSGCLSRSPPALPLRLRLLPERR